MSKSSNMRRAGYDAFIPNEGCRSADASFMLGWMEAKENHEGWVANQAKIEARQAEIEDSVEVYELDRVYSIDYLKRWIREYVVPHLFKGN